MYIVSQLNPLKRLLQLALRWPVGANLAGRDSGSGTGGLLLIPALPLGEQAFNDGVEILLRPLARAHEEEVVEGLSGVFELRHVASPLGLRRVSQA